MQFGTLGIGAQKLTVNNSNGFGLEFTGTTTMSGAPNFEVNGGNNTPVVQGLTLSGKVTGALNNVISLSGGGLQANGTVTTARQINTTGASTIDVTQGTVGDSLNIFTLTTPFNNGAASGSALAKNGNGIFEVNADNNGATPYTGVITINAGAIRVSNAGALGAAANNTVVANNIGSAVQINGVSTAELFNISNSGINSGGAIENFAGTSELTGLITLGAASTIGSTSGILNIKGGIVAGTNALAECRQSGQLLLRRWKHHDQQHSNYRHDGDADENRQWRFGNSKCRSAHWKHHGKCWHIEAERCGDDCGQHNHQSGWRTDAR